MIISTPTNPATTATHRAGSTFSFSRNTPSSVTSMGATNEIEDASAIGMNLSALKNSMLEAASSMPRTICSPRCRVRTRPSFMRGPRIMTTNRRWKA